MRMQSRRQLGALVVVTSVAAGLTTLGCSLGLDSSLIGQDGGIGSDSTTSADGLGSEGGGGGDSGDAHVQPPDGSGPTDAPPEVDAGACSTDADCQAAIGDAGGCVTSAKCDPTWHVCMLDVCAASA